METTNSSSHLQATMWLVALVLVAITIVTLVQVYRPPSRPSLVTTLYRLVVCRGMRLKGHLTGLTFPTHAAELTPESMTAMLRHGGHLGESGWAVVSVTDRLATIRDGVKVSTLACACPFFSDYYYPPSVYSRTPTPPHSRPSRRLPRCV